MSFVTIAVDDVPIIPAMTKISRVPQPSAQPSTRPAPKLSAMYEPPAHSESPPSAEELVDGELDPEVEEQQDQAEHRQQVDRVRVLEHDDARRLRAEDDPRDDEEGDRRQAEAPADASEQPGEQERRPEDGELVVHQHARGRPGTEAPQQMTSGRWLRRMR